MQPHERIIFPLVVSNVDQAQKLVDMLGPYVGVFKIGFEAICSIMAQLLALPSHEAESLLCNVRALAKAITSRKAFLDVKLNDIPNTVGNAALGLSPLRAKMINMHASAGKKAIQAVAANKGRSQFFGVTVLTSIGADDPDECRSIFGSEPNEKVLQFARMLADNGADGVICAPKEGLFLRQQGFGKTIACPNIRPAYMMTPEERERVKDDQNVDRQMTPGEAMKAGIDMFVIGRPISKPPASIGGPVEAAKLIAEEIAHAT